MFLDMVKAYWKPEQLLVDRLDTEHAVVIVRGVAKERLRFALDSVGQDTGAKLQEALDKAGISSHPVGLAGLPKAKAKKVFHHTVPLKAFHGAPKVGDRLMMWLEKL